ncbi:MAG: hypothetical protein HEQ35_20760 [Gloeotrichia echinulata IR180]
MKKLSSVLVVSLALLSPFAYTPAYPQAARVLTNSIDDLIRFAQRNAGKIRVQRTYKILQTTRGAAGEFVTTVSTVGGVYKIAIDCRNGRASNNLYALRQEEQVNFVRDVCRNFL